MEGLSKKEKELMDIDNSVVTAGEGGGELDGEGMGINGDGRRLDLGW